MKPNLAVFRAAVQLTLKLVEHSIYGTSSTGLLLQKLVFKSRHTFVAINMQMLRQYNKQVMLLL